MYSNQKWHTGWIPHISPVVQSRLIMSVEIGLDAFKSRSVNEYDDMIWYDIIVKHGLYSIPIDFGGPPPTDDPGGSIFI